MQENLGKKRKITAVICELNPLHFGHQALFRWAKGEDGALVCVLSGNFVQRGDAAILDKWARTRLALESGADLVLELPLPWACAGAERFAAGGAALCNALGNVDRLAFGSELPDMEVLGKIAQTLCTEEFSKRLSSLPETGEPFAVRREKVLLELLGEEIAPVLRAPNAILGVEYCKALLRQGSSVQPAAFPRLGAGHDGPGGEGETVLSAGELRRRIISGENIRGLAPEETCAALADLREKGLAPASLSRLELAILCKLRTMTPADFAALPDVSEGLEHKLYQAARSAGSLDELFRLAKSKRYSHARLRRLVLSAFLGLSADLPALPPYLRVLGVGALGGEILGGASPTLPVAVRPADFQKLGGGALRVFQLEARADDLYALAAPRPGPCGRDFVEKLSKIF